MLLLREVLEVETLIPQSLNNSVIQIVKIQGYFDAYAGFAVGSVDGRVAVETNPLSNSSNSRSVLWLTAVCH